MYVIKGRNYKRIKCQRYSEGSDHFLRSNNRYFIEEGSFELGTEGQKGGFSSNELHQIL